METRQRTSEDAQLREYYGAAIQYIDERLDLASSLKEVEAAAQRRRQSLASLPEPMAAADLAQLNEALSFVQRAHCRIYPERCDEAAIAASLDALEHPADEEINFEVLLKEAGEQISTSNGNGRHDHQLYQHSNGNGSPLNGGDGASLNPIYKPAQAATVETASLETSCADSEPFGSPTELNELPVAKAEMAETRKRKPGPLARHLAEDTDLNTETLVPSTRRSPLRALWEEQEQDGELLPEQRAWPIVEGLALIGAQTWLALFAGWVATRFVAWPHEGLGYALSWSGSLGVIVLGAVVAALAGWRLWRYRQATGRIAMLAHSAAVLVALDLFAWQLVSDGSVPYVPGPTPTAWVLLVFCWLVAASAAHMADLRR